MENNNSVFKNQQAGVEQPVYDQGQTPVLENTREQLAVLGNNQTFDQAQIEQSDLGENAGEGFKKKDQALKKY